MDSVGARCGQQDADIAAVGVVLGNAVLAVQEAIGGCTAPVGKKLFLIIQNEKIQKIKCIISIIYIDFIQYS